MQSLEQQTETAAHWSAQQYDALFAPEAPRRIALLAAEADELRGFAIARCGLDEWEIENVVVAPEHRRRGIARDLVQKILRDAHDSGVPSVLLEVRQSNTAARQLYEGLGFAGVGRRRAYYREPAEDALLLSFSMQNL